MTSEGRLNKPSTHQPAINLATLGWLKVKFEVREKWDAVNGHNRYRVAIKKRC
ncbi:MAG: hypothetical protein KatS3mg052_2595 [Candidatus Roseilinea sp.]|nr:MAG: hypothetical protein KatS3mg052_2595 [Candidatus Roseilinea sp.]